MADKTSGPSATPSLPAPLYKCLLCDQICSTPHGFKQHQGSQKCVKQTAKKKLDASKNDHAAPHATTTQNRTLRPRQRARVMRRIPKNSRHQAADAFTKVLEECARENTPATWAKLFAFATEIFGLPPSREERKVSLTTLVKRNVTAFEKNQPAAVAKHPGKPRKEKNIEEQLRMQVNMKLNEGDVSGAVRLLSSEDQIAPFSEETLQLLREKHPSAPDNVEYPPAPEAVQVPTVTTAEIKAALRSFHNGSAAGVDHLRPQHIKDMVGLLECDYSDKLCRALANVSDMILKGRVNKEAQPLLFGASLFALRKKDGGVRPIAVGHTLRRMAAKVVCNRVADQMGEKLRPRQLGFGTPGGCEAAVHAARAFIGGHHSETKMVLKLDFRNAFNCVDRSALFAAVKRDMPEYQRFFHGLYRSPTRLLFGDHEISSERGVQQGDPVGPLGFCMTIAPLVDSLVSPLNLWYLDDATVGGEIDVVLGDLDTVVSSAATYGLELNWGKCEAFVFGGTAESRTAAELKVQNVSPSIQMVKEDRLELLGAPLTNDSIAAVMEKKTRDLKLMVEKLKVLSKQQAHFLLRNCFTLPKLLYILRTSPTFNAPVCLEAFDTVQRSALESLLNSKMNDVTWRQATLPTRKAGMGIRLAEELAVPAYLASVFSASSLVSLLVPIDEEAYTREPLVAWNDKLTTEEPTGRSRKSQKAWDMLMVNQVHGALLSDAADDPLRLARLLAVSTPESGKYLTGLPSRAVGTYMEDDEFCVASQLRLGVNVCLPHICRCGQLVDQWGLHGLSCPQNPGTLQRHNKLNEIIGGSFATGGAPNRLEPSGLNREKRTRPDGMTLTAQSNGLPDAWDVTCVNTLGISHVGVTSTGAGKAAMQAEEAKVQHYEHLSDRFNFIPIGFETLGSWGPAAKSLIDRLGARIKERTGERRSLEFLKQRISVEIQRGNAQAVLSTAPDQKSLDGLFFLTSKQ